MAQTKPKAGQFYGVSDNGTDGEFLQTDGTGGMAWASVITNPTITSIDYPGTATAANPAGGESVIINGTLFASGITCTVGGTTATTVFNSATQITINTPAKSAGAYTVAVTNSNGGTASQANFIQYSGIPIWTTAAGNIGSVIEGAAASFQVTATEGTDTIEYAVTTGTLPTGLSLATATGAITGTAGSVSADTTTTFSITATDDENQTSAVRSFNITVQNDGPSNHFNTVLYNGNGGTQSISSLNFEPGLVWIKTRNAASNHVLTDIVRGEQKALNSDLTAAQGNQSPLGIQFESNGFTALGNSGGGAGVNGNSKTYVSWNLKAGGTAVTNDVGTQTTQVSANNTLGFSIVSYSTNNDASKTFGHGLDDVPELIITKATNGAVNWAVYNSTLGKSKFLELNSNNSQSSANSGDYWNTSTGVNSTVFGYSYSGTTYDFISYCFTSKAGFSKVGSYTGNNGSNAIKTDFEPAFLLIKSTSISNNWIILDNKRSPVNQRKQTLYPNANAAESTQTVNVNFFANGFELTNGNSDVNDNGATYIYLAIAADGSTATPTLANSFATELYTGNNTNNQAVTGVGFKPDFTWIGRRNAGSGATNYGLWDSVRGTVGQLYSNLTNAQTNTPNRLYSFDSDGFTLGNGSDSEYIGNNNWVSWNWKAAGGTPSINTDGAINSLISANQAAGFSIVKWTTSTSLATVGHGLGYSPELIIGKGINWSSSWPVYVLPVGNNKKMSLNDQPGATTSTIWGNTTPTATTFNQDFTGTANRTSIAYCWRSITGYSKVGSYTGTGNAGQVVPTGFTPSWVLIKSTVGDDNWRIFDTNMSNPVGFLEPNSNAIENTNNAPGITMTGTSFEITSGGVSIGLNANNNLYIYLAIKEN